MTKAILKFTYPVTKNFEQSIPIENMKGIKDLRPTVMNVGWLIQYDEKVVKLEEIVNVLQQQNHFAGIEVYNSS